MESIDMTQKNVERISTLFPNVITEIRDENGNIRKGINFEMLKQELSEDLVDGEECYEFTWAGKKAAIIASNTPIRKTLRPCIEESEDWENTGNLYIEGDNLDVLKLLQESYLNSIKMIYIDPPYNTGNDFIYRDSFKINKDEYNEQIGLYDEDENLLFKNTETNGRFHSDWCSMLYSRLKLAHNLLCENGLIFISIDDNEVDSLKKICYEIFGEDNFIACFIWEKRTNRENRKVISVRHDYVLCFFRGSKSKDKIINLLPMNDEALSRYSNPDNDHRGLWKSDPAHAQAGHATKSQFYVLRAPNGKEHHLPSGRCWLYTEEVMNQAIAGGRIWFGKDGNGVPRIKTYLDAKDRGLTPETIWFASDVATTEKAKTDLKELFNGNAVFDTPKPVELLKQIIRISASGGIVLDFFSGSAPLAQAVMESNIEDGGTRKFIMVQLPEPCSSESEAYKAGYRNICEIGKERIRRASKKIKEENKDKENINNLDTGFRVLKLDSTNMKDVYYAANEYNQSMLSGLESNIKEDRTDLDLLYGVLLDWGLPLSLKHKIEKVDGVSIHTVDEGSLVACFAEKVSESVVREIANRKPLRVVFRDSSFANSPDKINVEEIFKLLAPNTTVKVI